jgi:Zeta toxin
MRVDSSTLTTQIFPRANAAAMSSRSVMQAIGTKANSFAGKMVLDQLNGVISGQFTSLVTTGKFQSFREMLSDPSTYIGFATSAATTRGGGPTRANTDVAPAPKVNANVEAPRVNVDVNAPRANVDVNAPRTNVEPTAPRANVEPTAPRANADVNAPRVNTDVNAPRVNADVNAPRVDADAPRTSADTPAKKPGAIESFQNRIEAIQSKYQNKGAAFGEKVGYGYGDITGAKHVKVRTESNADLGPEGQRISGYDDSKTKLEVGTGAHPNDVAVHENVAKQTRADNSLVGKAKDLLTGGRDVEVNSRKYELEFEAKKHDQMADWREKAAAELPASDPQRARLLNEAAELRQRSAEFKEAANTASARNQSGHGEIEAVEKFDPSQSKEYYQDKAKAKIERLAKQGNISPEQAASLQQKLGDTQNPREAHDLLWNLDNRTNLAQNLDVFSPKTQEKPAPLTDPQQRQKFLQEQLDVLRQDTGIDKYTTDEFGNQSVTGGTVAIGVTDIPGLQNEVFRGGSKEAGGPANKTFESPQKHGGTKNHAEQNVGGQLDAKLQEMMAQKNIQADEITGNVYMHVDQVVCGACRQGVDSDVAPGIVSQMSAKYPKIEFTFTNSQTGEVIVVKGGKVHQSTDPSILNRAGILDQNSSPIKTDAEASVDSTSSSLNEKIKQRLTQGDETISTFTNKELPPYGPERWNFLDDPKNWTPERQALHQKLVENAQGDAQKFADAAQNGDPTIYAMRGNTAAGKTRAIKGNIPELEGPVNATKDLRHRAVNPDNFKVDLREAQTDVTLTSSQTHAESSMLAGKFEDSLKTIKTSDNTELGSILIDKRLARLEDVQQYAKMAQETGRKLNLYDVDAPLEVSLAGVLERIPGGNDPLPPYDVIAKGFDDVRTHRDNVIKFFQDNPQLGKYELYGTLPDGSKVKVAEVVDGSVKVFENELYLEVTAKPGEISQTIAKKTISSQLIESLTQSLSSERAAKVREVLEPYIGQTWETALNAHSAKKAGK